MSVTALQPAFDFCTETLDGSPAAARAAPTLGERLELIWESLEGDGNAECPVCRGVMARTADSGHCQMCGSTLA